MMMKSAVEIKAEIQRKMEEDKLNEVANLISWLEDIVIPRYINLQFNKCRIHDWDQNIGEHFDTIKPILERVGYKVEMEERREIQKRVFSHDVEHIDNFVVISWE